MGVNDMKRFKVGDYFRCKLDDNIDIIGRITKIDTMTYSYDLLFGLDNSARGFGKGSRFYKESKWISEKEVLARMI